jgi:hypothetical protein
MALIRLLRARAAHPVILPQDNFSRQPYRLSKNGASTQSRVTSHNLYRELLLLRLANAACQSDAD